MHLPKPKGDLTIDLMIKPPSWEFINKFETNFISTSSDTSLNEPE